MAPDVDIDRLDARINALGAALFFDPVTLAAAAAEGVDDPVALYAGGRAGAMGDVTAPVVGAAFGFFSPASVAEVWPLVLAAGRPTHLAEVFARALAEGARAHWDPDAAATLAAHGRAVIEAAPGLGLPLFSGWRAVAPPIDPCGAAAITVMTFRELRGDVNVQSVAGVGIDPHLAEMVTRGPAFCRLHGWPEPDPDPEPARRRMAQADAITSERMRQAWSALADDDLAAVDGAVATLSG